MARLQPISINTPPPSSGPAEYRANVINKLIDMGIKPNMDAPTESLERVLRAAIEKDKFLVEREYAAGGPVKKKKQIGGPIGTNEKQPLEQGALGQMYKGGGKIKKKKKMKKKMGHGGPMKKVYAKGGGIRKPTMGVN
jgi:hypothetical protein